MLAISDGGIVVIQLIVAAVFGIVCASLAQSRGRSAAGWFFIGVFTNCIGVILVLVLPNVKEQERRERRTSLENRRLREQLAKERQVSDSRHTHVERRLGAHDEALGVDTSEPPELTAAQARAQISSGEKWHYALDNKRQGPVSEETIRHLLVARAINRRTLVWSEGMEDWTPLGDVDEFLGDVG